MTGTEKLAIDRASVRTTDQDGHLHVAESPISKANICEYLGREIPDGERLGLAPMRRYRLLRDPEELKRGAATFDGKPLLIVHKPQVASDHDRQITVGAVHKVQWKPPFLMAALDVWDGEAIEGIETNEARELSSSYRYDADMQPGFYLGQRYDGVMRNIRGNHVALVPTGRAGGDVLVGDAALPEAIGVKMLPKGSTLSRRGAFALGALTNYLRPLVATDATIDLGPVMAGVTNANWSKRKPGMVAAIQKACKGKLAEDVDVGELNALVDKLGAGEGGAAPADVLPDDPAAEAPPPAAPPGVAPPKADDPAATIAELLAGVDPAVIAQIVAMVKPEAADAAPAQPGVPGAAVPLPGGVPAAKDAEPPGGAKVDDKPVTAAAMDAAIKAAVTAATTATMAKMSAVAAAKEAVRGVVGNLPVAMDSAESVYRLALDHMKDQGLPLDLAGVPEATFASVFNALAPSYRESRVRPSAPVPMASDSAAADTAKRFPNVRRLRSV